MSNYPEGKFCRLVDRAEVQLVAEYATCMTKMDYLYATPAHGAPRNRLRDLVSDRRAKSVKGNLAPEYAEGANTRFWARVNDTKQKLPWVIRGYTPSPNGLIPWSYNLRNTQSPPKPFESGSNVLPGLEAWCKRNEIHP